MSDTRLRLPDVTLVMIETREKELARLAVRECVDKVEFGDVLILTDEPAAFADLGDCRPRFHAVPDWPDKLGWSRAQWFEVPPLLRTRQTLNIQWDSWVWDASMWRDEFLGYDYIGAPWWYDDWKNVGNGGFSIASARLRRYVSDRRDKYPCDTHLDDDLLCRKYRPELEKAGFVWAPEWMAHAFAFECCRPAPDSRHFGFHALFNWPVVLERGDLLERLALVRRSPYIKSAGYMVKALLDRHPDLREHVVAPTPPADALARHAMSGADVSSLAPKGEHP